MVFRGKPSKGCKRCRQRRLRCDRKQEGCGNCDRARVKCPGYRNEIDLMFCDETTNLTLRFGGEKVNDQLEPVEPGSTYRDVAFKNQSKIPRDDLPAHVLGDTFALAYCYEIHVVRPDVYSNSRLEVQSEPLLMSMKALGMASFAIKTNSNELAVTARSYYTSAIRLINSALASPVDVVQDSTLLAVLLLAHFETTSGRSRTSLDAWAQHVQGLAAIIQLRGHAQLLTSEGRLTFVQALACIISLSFRTSTRIPPVIKATMEALSAYTDDLSDPAWRVPYLLIQLNDLKSDVANGLLLDPETIVAKMMELDEEFAAIFDNVSPQWGYETVPCHRTTDSCLPAYIQIFQTSLATQQHNTMRCGRIMCHAYIMGTIKSSLTPPTLLAQTQLRESQTITYRLQQDILSTVPQHLYLTHVQPYASDIVSYPDDAPVAPSVDLARVANIPTHIPALRTPRSWLMITHLVVAGRVAEPGKPVRKAISEMLLLAGQERGISQARVMAPALADDNPACFRSGVVNQPYINCL